MMDQKKTAIGAVHLAGLILAPLIALFLVLFVDLEPGKPAITATLAIAIWMAIWWITEAVPIPVTALLPVGLMPLLGAMNGKAVSSAYFNHVIFLFIGGFIMALAMERWNLHKRIAFWILRIVGKGPGRLLLGFMLATAFLSMWMSNTATAMMMTPIAMSVVRGFEEKGNRKAGVGLLLGVAYSASIGGIATLVGTPPNLSFVRIFSIIFPHAPEVSFARWLFFALPPVVLMFFFAWMILYLFYVRGEKSRSNLELEGPDGPMGFEEKAVGFLFALMAILWVFRSKIDLYYFQIPGWSSLFPNPAFFNDGTVAIGVAMILFVLPAPSQPGERIMDWATAERLPWGIVLLFGGGFALATAFAGSGLSLWFGEKLSFLDGFPPIMVLLGQTLSISFLTELTSNTATTEMLLPVLAGLAVTTGTDPLFFMIPATITASLAFILPVATPPNAVIFGTGRLTIPDMAKTGVILNLIAVMIVSFYTLFAGPAVLGIRMDGAPDWANIAKEEIKK